MRKLTKIMSLLLAVVLATGVFAACGGDGGGTQNVSWWVYGDQEELEAYQAITDEFNATYGKEHGIVVRNTPKPVGSYTSQVQLFSSSRSGPDVFFTFEDVFKGWVNAGYLAEISDYVNSLDADYFKLDEIYDTVVERLRYNVETNTSHDDDPLYGLPLDTKPSAIYYNESFFEAMGIIVISVDEADMDAWNAGTITDKRGKKKSDFAALDGVTVPKKGYYRSEYPFVDGGDGYSGWTKPEDDEILVFNNRIAMNWDELEDLARLFTYETNKEVKDEVYSDLDYGFFTEWWFNYGWSVGGDCLTDLSGSGKWNFSLLDYTSNYMVADGKTYVGEYSGTTYAAGETLTLHDKLALDTGKYLVADDVGGYHAKDELNATLSDGEKAGDGALGIRASVTSAASDGTLTALPSTREAFLRYLRLGASTTATFEGKNGLNVSPNPNVFSQRTRANYFYSGKMAMLVEYSAYMSAVSTQMEDRGWKWDVAPLAVYKQYSDPENPDCDTVIARGKIAGQSNSKSMCTRENSTKKEAAVQFMAWAASRYGQSVIVKRGFFPNYLDLVDDIEFPGYAPKNVMTFGEAMEFEGAGDWWYMKDFEWINIWAVPLNSNVRNGLMTYSAWKQDAIADTNDRLRSY